MNQEEMEKITLAKDTIVEKARDLCDFVIRKGPKACQIFINFICKEDIYLAGVLELSQGKN